MTMLGGTIKSQTGLGSMSAVEEPMATRELKSHITLLAWWSAWVSTAVLRSLERGVWVVGENNGLMSKQNLCMKQ